MITISEIYPIGYVSKTHGINGELNIQLDTDYNPEDFRFMVFEIDSTYIPFEVDNSRGQGAANRLVSLVDVDTIEEARTFVGKTAYVLKRELPDSASDDDEGFYLSDLVGGVLRNADGSDVGHITGFNDDTANYLLEVELPDGRHEYIPYVDDWVTDFNPDGMILTMNLPNGLI